MKPIISPWLIYGIDLLEKFRVLFIILTVGLAVTGATFVLVLALTVYDWEDINWKAVWKTVKPGVIVFPFVLTASILCPDKNTVYQMIVASQITPDNIQTVTQVAGDTAEDVADYVIDIITRVSEATQKGE